MPVEALSHDELTRLLTVARARRERDWLIFLVMYRHALRVQEVLNIKAEDIKDGFLTVKRLKGSLKTVQGLITAQNPLMNETGRLTILSLTLLPNQRLFTITKRRVHQLMREYCREAGIPEHKAHPHILKHTCCAHLLKNEKVELVREWAGHKSLSSTGFYTRLGADEVGARVRQAFTD